MWVKYQISLLIDMYKKHTYLYVVKSKMYSNKHARLKALEEICQEVTKIRSDIHHLHTVLVEALEELSNQQPLHDEAALLSRIIYRMDRKFRSDIGFQSTKKVNTALLRFLKMDLKFDLNSFMNVIPMTYDDIDTYLPTKQMLQYILVRLQAFAKLMSRIIVCSEKAALFYRERINRGQSWNVSLVALANHSKIWSDCKKLGISSFKWYANLLPYLDVLEVNGADWIPEGYCFPEDLQVWLNERWADVSPHEEITMPLAKLKQQKVFELIALSDDDEVEFCFEQYPDCEIIETTVKQEEHKLCTVEQFQGMDKLQTLKTSKEIDIGESLSREDIKLLNVKKSKNVKHKKSQENYINKEHNIETVRNSTDLLKFIKKEELLRNEDSPEAFSRNVGIMQWHALKNKMNASVKKLSKNKVKNNPDKVNHIINNAVKIWLESINI